MHADPFLPPNLSDPRLRLRSYQMLIGGARSMQPRASAWSARARPMPERGPANGPQAGRRIALRPLLQRGMRLTPGLGPR